MLDFFIKKPNPSPAGHWLVSGRLRLGKKNHFIVSIPLTADF